MLNYDRGATGDLTAETATGQRGTKKPLEKHGDALVCVRYRYDEARGIRMKTVALVVEQTAWQPSERT